jgi:Opioid growth factor receptor (OGFr) conserved region
MQYLEFFKNKNVYKYKLDEILAWPNSKLESTHDFIQLVFPNFEKSKYNTNTPDLTLEEVNAIKNDPVAYTNMLNAWRRMFDFYGFKLQSDTVLIDFFTPHWISLGNHNYLRITRIIKCMKIFQLDNLANSLMNCLEELYPEYSVQIGLVTLDFWRNAADSY